MTTTGAPRSPARRESGHRGAAHIAATGHRPPATVAAAPSQDAAPPGAGQAPERSRDGTLEHMALAAARRLRRYRLEPNPTGRPRPHGSTPDRCWLPRAGCCVPEWPPAPTRRSSGARAQPTRLSSTCHAHVRGTGADRRRRTAVRPCPPDRGCLTSWPRRFIPRGRGSRAPGGRYTRATLARSSAPTWQARRGSCCA